MRIRELVLEVVRPLLPRAARPLAEGSSLSGEFLSLAERALSGSVGSRVIRALSDPGVVRELSELDSATLVVDLLGRNPELLYVHQYGSPPEYLLKRLETSPIEPREFPELASSVASALRLVSELHPRAKIRLLLVAPTALAFLAGALLGPSEVTLLQLSGGRYVEISARRA